MKKFIVETYYTCTFKTLHKLDDLNDQELSKINDRTDGDVEVIDVKLNNRKTKKIGDLKNENSKNIKIKNSIPESIKNSHYLPSTFGTSASSNRKLEVYHKPIPDKQSRQFNLEAKVGQMDRLNRIKAAAIAGSK